MSAYEGPIVDVIYENVDGWHRFSSPEVPKLHVLAEPGDYYLGLEKVRQTIEVLTNARARGFMVRHLTRLPTCECLNADTTDEIRPRVLRFSMETYHRDKIDAQEARDQIRRLENLYEKPVDPDTRAIIQKMIAEAEIRLSSSTKGKTISGIASHRAHN